MSGPIKGSMAENVITALCFCDAIAPQIAECLDPKLLEPKEYAHIAGVAIEYIRKYKETPKNHIFDLLEKEIKGRELPNGDYRQESTNKFYEHTCEKMVQLAPEINEKYVLDQLEPFIERYRMMKALSEAVSAVGRNELEKARALVRDGFAPNTPPEPTGDLRALLDKELPPMRWLVPDFIPEGLTLLASEPKAGKSFLALNIALACVAGLKVLGQECPPRGVYGLFLEDNERRLQARCRAILGTRKLPADVPFKYDFVASTLAHGLITKIESVLTENPGIGLVIVDTLGFARGDTSRNNGQIYAEDVAVVRQFKELAAKHNLSILLIHHTRKSGGTPLERVSGSNGLTGTVDTILTLEPIGEWKDAANDDDEDEVFEEREVRLRGKGRDLDCLLDKRLTFRSETMAFDIVGNFSETKPKSLKGLQMQILQHLVNLDVGHRAQDIAEALGKDVNTIKVTLARMKKNGLVVNPMYSFWQLTKKGEAALPDDEGGGGKN